MTRPRLVVFADDRTGALEVAGECAQAGLGPAVVEVFPSSALESVVTVIDVSTRHLTAGELARRVQMLGHLAGVRTAYKIDSMLRGNWAHELVERWRTRPFERVLVIPAFPGLGRVCIGGVVYVDGIPVGVAGADARSSRPSSRPVDHLVAAGATAVDHLDSVDLVQRWLAADRAPFAVCDAATDADLAALGLAWARHDGVLLAGTAASIGAAAGALAAMSPSFSSPPAPVVDLPALVVCGSLHPMARRQLAELERRDSEGKCCTIVTTTVPDAVPVDAKAAERCLVDLSRRVRDLLEQCDFASVVIVGGDTAAAILGDGTRWVGGCIAPGIPWSHEAHGGQLVVTKAGSFGEARTLVELFGCDSP